MFDFILIVIVILNYMKVFMGLDIDVMTQFELELPSSTI